VRRVRDDADRRRVMVEVTPEVERRIGAVFAPFLEDGQVLAARYSADEWAVILRFMRDDRALLQKHTALIHRLVEDREHVAAREAGSAG